MQQIPRSRLGVHIAEVAYSAVIIIWYVLPFLSSSLGGFNPRTLGDLLYGSNPDQAGALWTVTVMAYLIPLICLWKIASLFLPPRLSIVANPELPIPVGLNILSSGLVVALVILDLVNRAHNASYFSGFPPSPSSWR